MLLAPPEGGHRTLSSVMKVVEVLVETSVGCHLVQVTKTVREGGGEGEMADKVCACVRACMCLPE